MDAAAPIALSASPRRPTKLLDDLCAVLVDIGPAVVACSGGIDSLLLARVAHRFDPKSTVVHTVTPAVPSDDTARVLTHARREGWRLEVVRSHEFDDERYLSNPTDRCYYCKSNLYDAIDDLRASLAMSAEAVIVSGANTDDLGEYRPGLIAADEHSVRHPYVEAGIGKAAIRSLARHLGLAEADLPASPCLASRLYTGTRVTAERLQAIELGESVVRSAGVAIVRCRIDDDRVFIEAAEEGRALVTEAVIADVIVAMRTAAPDLAAATLDDRPYRPGQAVVGAS